MEIITTDSENKSVLYQPALEVKLPLSDVIKEKIEQMRLFYKTIEEKGGFAAPQVGISERIMLVEKHFFAPNLPNQTDEPAILINPSWKPIDEKKELDIEGCLSVPDKIGVVERFVNVELTALLYCPETEKIAEIKRQYQREYASVLWQHEVDHLNGHIYTDKAMLLLNRSDFAIFQQYLIEAGKLEKEMTLFDIGSLIYELAQKWLQEKNKTAQAFLETITH